MNPSSPNPADRALWTDGFRPVLRAVGIALVISGLGAIAGNQLAGLGLRPGSIGLLSVGSGVLLLLRAGRVRLAAQLFCWGLLLTPLGVAMLGGGLSHVIWVAAPIAALSAGLMLGRCLPLALAACASVAVAAVCVLHLAGHRFEPSPPPVVIALSLIAANVVAALLGRATATAFGCQIELVQAAREALAQQNLLLEQRVQERTADLVRARELAERANAAKGEFLTRMTHELRTPLHAILGFAEVLERLEGSTDAATPPAAPRRAELLATIRRNGRHLLGLVDELLDMDSIERGQLALCQREFDLAALLRACVDDHRPAASAKGLRLRLDLSGRWPARVRTDGRRLTQILHNLLDNAIKFTPRGDVVLAAEYPGAGMQAGTLRLTVCDSGPGVPDAERELIFGAFAQGAAGVAAGKGSGLGLAISRELAQRLGGELRLDPDPGPGSRFSLSLPLQISGWSDPPSDDLPTGPPVAVPPTATDSRRPPAAALHELRALAELGRTTLIEHWCRTWSDPARCPGFAREVEQHAMAFEHPRIVALVDASLDRREAA